MMEMFWRANQKTTRRTKRKRRNSMMKRRTAVTKRMGSSEITEWCLLCPFAVLSIIKLLELIRAQLSIFVVSVRIKGILNRTVPKCRATKRKDKADRESKP
jgi:hypothetical protein